VKRSLLHYEIGFGGLATKAETKERRTLDETVLKKPVSEEGVKVECNIDINANG
jgi:hypothetical protein